jgi:hypothetical protein
MESAKATFIEVSCPICGTLIKVEMSVSSVSEMLGSVFNSEDTETYQFAGEFEYPSNHTGIERLKKEHKVYS